jgi:protein TonB
VEGTVVLRVLVDETGQVRSVKHVSGPGGGLDEAAAKAVARFRFRPALRKGQPVATEIRYAYTFELD